MPSETDRARPLYGALAGLLTGAVAVGVGQLVASIGAQNSSPFVAVGDAAIGLAPEPVKSFAITEFGSHDKPVLLIGIGVVLAIFAAGIGVLAAWRLVYGLAGLGVFTAIGLAAAGTRPGADAGYYVPTLVAAAASAFTMVRLVRAIPASQARPPQAQPGQEHPAGPPGRPTRTGGGSSSPAWSRRPRPWRPAWPGACWPSGAR